MCDRCVSTHYMNEKGRCVVKPEGVEFDTDGTTIASLKVSSGFYRFTIESEDIYECPSYDNCAGGKIPSNGSATTLCRRGSGGPLCSVCESEYFLSE